MSLSELFIIAIGLSMDAFAVAVSKGLSMRRINIKRAGIVGLYFGTFQAGMPLIGYFLGVRFQDKITSIDHWIALLLLVVIGINMIRDSKKSKQEIISGSSFAQSVDDSLSFRNMSVLATATSIDALAVGVTFAFLKVNIVPAVSFIGIITLILSMIGVKIGNVFGVRYKSKAEFAGGLILILMGIKILLEHTGIINF
ncbi:MAG: manganese efflux pump MntP family protein [Desulfotomaculaceae bacterium]|nr:manganese efflux pump MntP family protein [Desulfotomaculaceae bacterium]